MSLTTKEVAEWKSQEVTQKVLDLIREEIDQNIAHIASGRVIADSMDETAQRVCRTSGVIEGLGFLFEIEGDSSEIE